jgi:hypothetical protein
MMMLIFGESVIVIGNGGVRRESVKLNRSYFWRVDFSSLTFIYKFSILCFFSFSTAAIAFLFLRSLHRR